MGDFFIDKELREFDSEKKSHEIELNSVRNKYALMLNNGMGEDMINVINGKTQIKIPLRQRILFKIKCFFNNLFDRL